MKVDKIVNMSDAEINKQLKINTKKVLNNLDKIPQTPKRFFIKKYSNSNPNVTTAHKKNMLKETSLRVSRSKTDEVQLDKEPTIFDWNADMEETERSLMP